MRTMITSRAEYWSRGARVRGIAELPASASLTPGWNEPKITPRASELLRSPRWLRPDRDVRLASKPLPELRARRRRERTASAQLQEPPPLDIRECRARASRSGVASGDRL